MVFTCGNASHWPVGRRTSQFLQSINQHLPDHFRVY